MVENARNENEFEIVDLLFRYIPGRINSMHIFCILAILSLGLVFILVEAGDFIDNNKFAATI